MARGIAARILGRTALIMAVVVASSPTLALAGGQAGAKARPAPRAQAQPAAELSAPVAKVIELTKSGISENRILRLIEKEGLHTELSSADSLALKKAGVTDRVIDAMESVAPAATPTMIATGTPADTSGTPAPVPATPARPTASAAAKRVVVIDEFDWAAVRTPVQQVFGTPVDIGKGIRALLTTRIHAAGKMRLVERANLQKVMDEGDRAKSSRFKAGTGPGAAGLIGADAILMGEITTFGRDDQRKGIRVGAGGIPLPFVPNWIGGSIGGSEGKQVIVINYRIVDATSGELIDSGEARGESSRKSKGIKVSVADGWRGADAGAYMGSSNFAETIIGEATMAACDRMAAILDEKVSGLVRERQDVEARVAATRGNAVTITAGTNSTVAVQDLFDVLHITDVIKDQVTGEILDYKTDPLGTLVITSVRERIAEGTYSGRPLSPKIVAAGDVLVRRRL